MAMRARTVERARAVERLRVRLLQRRLPRVQMSLIVVLTGLAGFIFSFVLREAGVDSMALRYPLAATLAYAVFLLQLRVWLALVRKRATLDLEPDPFDLVDIGIPDPPGIDLDEGVVVFVPVVIALAGFAAAAWVVYSAPVLFAELILDGIIVSRLYSRFRKVPPEGLLSVAIRRTWVPLLVLIVVLGALGVAAERFAPGADSIGDVFADR